MVENGQQKGLGLTGPGAGRDHKRRLLTLLHGRGQHRLGLMTAQLPVFWQALALVQLFGQGRVKMAALYQRLQRVLGGKRRNRTLYPQVTHQPGFSLPHSAHRPLQIGISQVVLGGGRVHQALLQSLGQAKSVETCH